MQLSLMDLADETRPRDIAKSILRMLRSQFNGRAPIPIPIEEIVLALDIVDIEYRAFRSIDGTLIIGEDDNEGTALICVNSNQSNPRIRYTIGHELGHWLIPSHKINKKSFECSNQYMRLLSSTKDSTPIEKIEIEANIFSCELLLPEIEFKQELRRFSEPCISHILTLSQLYNISKLATGRRFVSLNDHACAIIQSHDYQVTHIYKHKDFPVLAIKLTNPLPPRSLSARDPNGNTYHTELLPSAWTNWLKNQPPKHSELYEQVLYQQDKYRFTLLYLDTRNCLDEEEMKNEKLELTGIGLRFKNK